MSKIVTMKCQVPWISLEDTYERLTRVLPEMPSRNDAKYNATLSKDAVIIYKKHIPLLSISKCGNDSTMLFRGDDAYLSLTNKIIDEVLLDTIKEKALRNKYHVTVNREQYKMTVLLER